MNNSPKKGKKSKVGDKTHTDYTTMISIPRTNNGVLKTMMAKAEKEVEMILTNRVMVLEDTW